MSGGAPLQSMRPSISRWGPVGNAHRADTNGCIAAASGRGKPGGECDPGTPAEAPECFAGHPAPSQIGRWYCDRTDRYRARGMRTTHG